MANWTKAIIKHRFSVVTTWLLLIVIGGFAATNLNQHLTTSLSVPSSESAKAEDILLRSQRNIYEFLSLCVRVSTQERS
jgi:uncharacterized membrane protein YdfJ with MMPL/SSD domain